MRRILSLMLAILISGVAFGQMQPTNVSKALNQSKESKTSITQSNTQMDRVQRVNSTIHYANPNKAITGSFSLSPTTYIPGQTMILHFNFTFSSTDLEFVDGVSITFPTGITPQETNTSTTISGATLVTPISGNAVVWGQITTPSGYGSITPGSYDFQVAVTVGAGLTGQQSIVCYAMGDGYGSTPHAINQTIIMTEALAHDVAVTGILLQNIYSTGTTVTPKAIISNIGTSAETVNMQFVINDGTTDVYTSTVTGHAIASGDIDTIIFTPDWTASTPGSYTATCYFTTTDNNITNDTLNKAFLVSDPIWGFAWNAYDPNYIIPEGPVKVNLASGDIIPIGSYSGTDFMPGADFIQDEWYLSSYDSKSLLTIDTTSGDMNIIGNMGYAMNGLAYDVTTDKLYGCASVSGNSILFEINYYNASVTQIGTICSGSIIGIAANSHGNLYGINITDDKLYKINKTTGAGTAIGSLGYDISYAQDIAFDRDNDNLYGALYADNGILCIIDTLTGAVTIFNEIPNEITGLAFPYSYTRPDVDIKVSNLQLPQSGCGLPANVTITATLKNIGNNDLSNIPINISINNGTPITETVAGPIPSLTTLDYTFTHTFDFSTPGTYNVKVYTSLAGDENNNNDTITGVVNSFAPSSIPITIDFENANLFDQFTIIDANNDGSTWSYINDASYAHSGTVSLAYKYNLNNDANDYFFSNCIELLQNESFNVSLWYRARGTSYPESFEVYLATAPDPSAIIGSPIITKTNINNTTYQEASADATVSADGIYYLVIKATSAANMYYLYIDDIKIRKLLDHDVAVAEILLQDTYTTGATVQPRVKIANEGLNSETIDITFKINDGTTDVYTSTVSSHAIASGEEHTVTFSPDWTATAGSYTATCTITTTDDNPSNNTLTKTFIVSDPIWAFAWNVYDPNEIIAEGPVKVNLATGEITKLGSYTSEDLIHGGDFVKGTWYASNRTSKTLIKIDTTTGVPTTVGSTNVEIYGLAYDHSTDKLYGTNTTSGNSILYEINYQNGSTTQIGNICSGTIIGLAADINGNLYGINMTDDKLYKIDKSNGTGTAIGSLEYDIAYVQDIAFDRDNNILYGALCRNEDSPLAIINTTTGSATVLTFIDPELTALAIPYTYNAINDISVNDVFSIYPNPANEQINIISNTNMTQITIVNSLGQIVMAAEPNADFYQINTSTLPEGIYTTRITTNNGLSTKLIVVSH